MYNQSTSILSAWQSIEILQPYIIKSYHDFAKKQDGKLVHINNQQLPWQLERETLPIGQKYCYQLLLGNLKLNAIHNRLIDVFEDHKSHNPPTRETALIAAINIDENGCIGPIDQLIVSSFAWAYPLVLKHQFSELNNWSQHQPQLQSDLHQFFINSMISSLPPADPTHRDFSTPYLTKQAIDLALQLLMQKLELHISDIEPSFFIIEKVIDEPYREYLNLPFLNSFLIDELDEISVLAANNKISSALQLYLQTKKVSERTDVLTDQNYLKNLLAPTHMPLGRWPSPQGHSLILLQQAIVNAVCSKNNSHDLLAINGPPGTGKTTIIRDIIADQIVSRASAMAEFIDPEMAFTYKCDVRVFSETKKFYTLDPKLTGFEILIASSNNNAVENVSKELLYRDAIVGGMSDLHYFNATSDAIEAAHNQRKKHCHKSQTQHQKSTNTSVEAKTWGLIAAVLGNRSNIYKFCSAFWGLENTSIKSYLKIAQGSYINSIGQQDSNISDHLITDISVNPDVPQNKFKALTQWQQAVKVFHDSVDTVQQQLAILENAHIVLKNIEDLRQQHAKFLKSITRIDDNIKGVAEEEAVAKAAVNQYILQSAVATTQLYKHKIDQPSFWQRFTKRAEWKQWHFKFSELKQADQQLCTQLTEHQSIHKALADELSKLNSLAKSIPTTIANFDEKINNYENDLDHARILAQKHFADAQLWARNRQELQNSTVWLSAQIQRSRDQVFKAALGIHKAFIGAAAVPLYENLNILIALLSNCRSIDLNNDDLADLWRNLFLVTPIASTTFASVKRMFGKLPSESIGWLIVDEAGQASPQAVVGAMQRCRRAVILGDPVQLEPIRLLPNKLLDAICHVYNVNPQKWSPAYMSTQSCADAVSTLGTLRGQANKQAWVGLPLLVHRRCADPMFSISNNIAYDDAMIHAADKRSSLVEHNFTGSCWFDIKYGYSDNKWNLDEGLFAIHLIEKFLESGCAKPNFYVLSPFKSVADRMIDLFKTKISEPNDLTDAQERWFTNRIGTVHAFQGKEADVVIFLLGASAPDEHMSRQWAGRSPNLINVAVTRAKSAIYVVGNYQLWYRENLFRILASHLPIFNVDPQTL